ncbi:MAG: hypothetical protein DHS20C12_02780 [Pseudohongiella sp.]|nr:MAG: hypothetical protein DHS20C12_02780 [Pseudohongiella sp.]
MTPSLKKIASLAALFFSVSAVNAQDAKTVWDGVYTEEQASRGEAVYTQACIACHGQDLGGNSNSPALTGMSFMFLWEGRSLGEFYETIRSEMPTDRPGQLPEQDYLDVVAYILQKNAFPSSSDALPLSSEALDKIDIVSE